MLKYPCLILDHDDTVVASEETVHYPCFVEYLNIYRPGMTMTFHEYVDACCSMPFVDLCKTRFAMNDEELQEEYEFWKNYIKGHFPTPYPGVKELLLKYKEMGGKICVSSLSTTENILRDYRSHFGFEPDMIFSWDLPEELRKPNPYAAQQVMTHYGFKPHEILVVDDMKHSVGMARDAGCPIAFAGWGRKEFPNICQEMEKLCDFSFYSTEEFKKFLFS